MKTFNNSVTTFLSEINNIIQENDTISIMANSFSFHRLEKLSNLTKKVRFQIIISDTTYKDFEGCKLRHFVRVNIWWPQADYNEWNW